MPTHPSGSLANLPSQCAHLAAECVGARITAVSRILRYPEEKLSEDFELVDNSQVFNLAGGEIYLSLGNRLTLEIRRGSPHSRSIVLATVERNLIEIASTPDYLDRTGLVIGADDPQYSRPIWNDSVSPVIERVAYLHLQDEGDPRAQNQRAVKFYLDCEEPLLIGAGLRTDMQHLTILRVEDIDPSLLPKIREISL